MDGLWSSLLFPASKSLATAVVAFQGGAILFKSADQTAANFNHTTIAWDSEVYDTDAFHDVGTNTQRITIPSAHDGKYGVLRATFYVTGVGNTQHVGAYFHKAGGAFVGAANDLTNTTDSTECAVSIESPEILLATGDIFTAVLYSSDTSTSLEAEASSFSIEITG